MVQNIKVGMAGLSISFLGALPFGTLNLTAFDISASQGLLPASYFAIAVVLVELLVVRLTLVGSERLLLGEKAMRYILPLGILLLVYLAISSFLETTNMLLPGSKAGVLPQVRSTFVLGLLLSAFNPLQIPFWLTWNKVLENKGLLTTIDKSYVFYILGIGFGTLVALGVFIIAGKYIFNNYNQYHKITNMLMGSLYLAFSFYLMFLLIKKRINYKIQ